MTKAQVVNVFADGPHGGNPAPVAVNAADLTSDEMQAIAGSYGLESAFVVDATGTDVDLALRFWVPNHEMEMCGHATIAAVWLLARQNRFLTPSELTVQTASGVVRAQVGGDGSVRISQPVGTVEEVAEVDRVLDVLRLRREDLTSDPVVNATTSRTKTLVPVREPARLDAIAPDLDRVEDLCMKIGSTGLYPYAPSGDFQFDARQFPRSSGYPEDAATGIAATALVFGLLAHHTIDVEAVGISVRQGRAMGKPSRIRVDLDVVDGHVAGCWLGGPAEFADRDWPRRGDGI